MAQRRPAQRSGATQQGKAETVPDVKEKKTSGDDTKKVFNVSVMTCAYVASDLLKPTYKFL